ncbi:MAG TPA: hypothetical protein P5120_13640 [Spirochaetota bacterium]|nr:hypothetical protein [Spirochaetota bacterium]HPF06727.1 hypothetical protein [Spirochaetota bacterium]HPJ43309.1 hypothetical protein [Spirochaetota bacterium]HPR38652.1 hypothetical protein [Spirochaetota bacterium]HRX48556.1 hypothetical protein [Spirochaetota bacterium]
MENINVRVAAALFSILISSWSSIFAASGDFGAGFILGEPTGLTAKYFITGTDAVDSGLGASYHNGFYIYADYLKHFPEVFPVDGLALYVGAGAGFHHHNRDDEGRHHDGDDYNSLECRIPVGLEYTLQKAPLGIFLELVPALEIIPDIDSDIRGGLGLRYYF